MSIKEAARARAEKSGESGKGEQLKNLLKRSQKRDNQRWSFGFRYFKEIDNFGLDSDKIDRKWALSVMYRLGELSALTLESVLDSRTVADRTLRMHDIDWKWRSIPIKRADIDWIGDDYIKNAEEFPFFQVSVSKAMGRLVGFMDEDNVFQVVLLDPLHNAQPSKFNDYVVRMCKPLGCEVTSIRYSAVNALKKIAARPCGCVQEIESAFQWTKRQPGEAFVIPVVDGTGVEDADKLIEEGKAGSYLEIFEAGLVALA